MQVSTESAGALVAERYRVEAVLGRGATGMVYRARRLTDDYALALKLLSAGGDGRLQGRFLRGARLAARIVHPNVVRTLDFGRWGEDGRGLFVAMELVDGLSMDRLGPALGPAASRIGMVMQILEALDHVHARGVLHRDIKPANVLISRSGDGRLRARVVDFGLAAARAPLPGDDGSLTLPGTVLGTPLYMAPEQADGQLIDAPSLDLYPVGVILYQLLAGVTPFSGPPMTVLAQKLSRDPPPLVPLPGLDVPQGLISVVQRLLARRPSDRYAVAGDAMRALAPYSQLATATEETWRDATAAAGLLPGLQGPPSEPAELIATLDQAAADRQAGLPMVGRDEQLARAEAVAAEVEGGEGRALVLVGGAGMGRSTMLSALCVQLAQRGRFRVLRSAARDGGGMLDALRLALEGPMGVVGRGRAVVAGAVRELLAALGDAEAEDASALLELLRPSGQAISNGAELQGRVFATFFRILRRMAAERPVVLAIDDLERGGATAVALLEFALFELSLEHAPILLIGTVLDGGDGSTLLARTARYEGRGRVSVRLGPIPVPLLGGALVDHLGLPRAEALHIARRSAGNPLVALHLAHASSTASRMTVLDWMADSTSGGSSSSISHNGGLPSALRDMLASGLSARLARNKDAERLRSLLQDMAVLGEVVAIEPLARLVEDRLDRRALDEQIEVLLDLGVLQLVDNAAVDAVTFSPILLRDLMLSALNPRRARRLHQRAIEVRTQMAGAALDAEAGALGDHLDALGRQEEAARFWLRGMRHEIATGDALRGVTLGRKALDVLSGADREASESALAMGRLLLDLGDMEQSAAVLVPLVEGPDVDLALRAGDALADVYENKGAGDAWTRLLDRMEERVPAAGPVGRRSYAVARALWCNYHTRATESVGLASAALRGADPGEQSQRAAQRLSFAYMVLGDLDLALDAAHQAIAHAGQRPDLRVRSLRTLGTVFSARREAQDALAAQEEVLAICRRSGLLARVPIAMCDLADALRAAGDMDRALIQYRASARAAERLGLTTQRWMAESKEALTELMMGRTEGLAVRLVRMASMAESSGMGIAQNFVRVLMGWELIEQGRADDALACIGSVRQLDQFLVEPSAGEALEHMASRLRVLVDPQGWTAEQRQVLERMVDLSIIQAQRQRNAAAIARRAALAQDLPQRQPAAAPSHPPPRA